MTVQILRPRWPAPPNVMAVSTLRPGGVSHGVYRSLNLGDHVGDAADNVLENRRRLRSDCELPAEPRWLRQVHGVDVVDLDREAPGSAAGDSADAAFTRRPHVVCAVLTADCLPVLFAAVDGESVAVAHAGWRGLAAGVLEATVAALDRDPSRLMAWLGPAIGPRRFEVGAEVRERFLASDRGADAAFVPGEAGRFFADLPLLARRRLATLGLTQVFAADECTHSQPERFFSHRRDGQTGRQATLIWKR